MTLSRRAAWLLVVTFVWTWYVWITRMWVIAHDPHGFAFVAVHGMLAIISMGLGLAVGVVGWRALQAGKAETAAKRASEPPREPVGPPPA